MVSVMMKTQQNESKGWLCPILDKRWDHKQRKKTNFQFPQLNEHDRFKKPKRKGVSKYFGNFQRLIMGSILTVTVYFNLNVPIIKLN